MPNPDEPPTVDDRPEDVGAWNIAAPLAPLAERWHPDAVKVEPADGRAGLAFAGVAPKIVLHTTESAGYHPSVKDYFGNPYWPHATIIPGTIYQHLPIDVGAYALYSDGSVATNRANAIQCEIVWRADNADWPERLLATVASWVAWVQAQAGVPTVIAEMFREGAVVASVDSPIRFGDGEWLAFTGICGHSNVPGGNDHWDPGRLPVDRLRAALGAPPAPSIPTIASEEDTMLRYVFDNQDYVFPGPDRGDVFATSTDGQLAALNAAGVKPIGQVDETAHAMFRALGKGH